MNYRFFLFIGLLIVLSCARRGRPEGGPKDFDKPVMIKAEPAFESVHFDTDEIKIYFDEFVKLKNINTQLIVSTPLKYNPIISPLGTPSKKITIKIQDTLLENTTYTFNFGQSIIDNTEGNILDNFKYVFSTGDYIDSLRVGGTIKDAFELELKDQATLMLYPIVENFNDSIIYKEKPTYVGSLLDSVNWEITNIKAGKYLLVALKDSRKDYKYMPAEDQIAFVPNYISVPSDTLYHLSLFKEILKFDVKTRPEELSKGHIIFGFEGDGRDFVIDPISEKKADFKSKSIFDEETDTLHYWFKNYEKDTIRFFMYNKVVFDTVRVALRSEELDSLSLTNLTKAVLHLRDTFKINTNAPIAKIDTSLINFMDKDSVKIKYHHVLSKYENRITFNFEKEFNTRYDVLFLPGAITDFFDVINDTLQIKFSVKEPRDYASVYLTLNNINFYPIIVELLNSKGEVGAVEYADGPGELKFTNLEPSKYMVRIIYDGNGNRKWDTGNFLERKQPEIVYYFKNLINAKANWQVEESFSIE